MGLEDKRIIFLAGALAGVGAAMLLFYLDKARKTDGEEEGDSESASGFGSKFNNTEHPDPISTMMSSLESQSSQEIRISPGKQIRRRLSNEYDAYVILDDDEAPVNTKPRLSKRLAPPLNRKASNDTLAERRPTVELGEAPPSFVPSAADSESSERSRSWSQRGLGSKLRQALDHQTHADDS
mmetsp:Transcript_7427/g.21623  ORF Transcript_7427/g.21623 Transcript_7427/m.21623 type:complete len:182 (-) Transcript_7427:205-750(-)|eukprot:CAMPEP_0118876356 /NCGR_PEP_ID=MMETSP1163-20130328/17083_1 /TAXON_ID=124430 /ORGANISM="Phaeomonas parva, Strain CCMP2877" /LENGTH=181 /DNA_ID=CAMNT_0006811963 /DNA_START=135 /DNA_END=680 /DNA_ORIENTATION=+